MMLAVCSLFIMFDTVDAATRAVSTRANTATQRKTTVDTIQTTSESEQKIIEDEAEETETIGSQLANAIQSALIERPEPVVVTNKSNQFQNTVFEYAESLTEDNAFAEQIRKQRDALALSEATSAAKTSLQNSLSTNSNTCDASLRKCMMNACGKDFTKCATDGDTTFGDKLNKCRRDTECTGEEFNLFTKEIKEDRDTNVRLASYNAIIDCGNNYNACIIKECGTTYTKCLGKKNADAAVQKCSNIALECRDTDSGLASRFGTAIGKLRENAEIDVKRDEERLYALRDLMAKQCKSLGATFDERSFDCVHTVNFFAGTNQSTPMASRKAYAGDSFVCMQEWFGVNATTFKENAYRETRSQTAASSAMLGSGLGTAAGIVSSGALDRALDTQKSKKALKEECEKQGKELKDGKCIEKDAQTSTPTQNDDEISEGTPRNTKCAPIENALTLKRDCTVLSCKPGYHKINNDTVCAKNEKTTRSNEKDAKTDEQKFSAPAGIQTITDNRQPIPDFAKERQNEIKQVLDTASDFNPSIKNTLESAK